MGKRGGRRAKQGGPKIPRRPLVYTSTKVLNIFSKTCRRVASENLTPTKKGSVAGFLPQQGVCESGLKYKKVKM